MSTSMVATVLEIEREAEAILAKAEQDAEKVVADAKVKRETASKSFEDGVRKGLTDLEAKAAAERAKKVKELAATGEVALSAVRNISDAAFGGGVRYVMKALTGE